MWTVSLTKSSFFQNVKVLLVKGELEERKWSKLKKASGKLRSHDKKAFSASFLSSSNCLFFQTFRQIEAKFDDEISHVADWQFRNKSRSIFVLFFYDFSACFSLIFRWKDDNFSLRNLQKARKKLKFKMMNFQSFISRLAEMESVFTPCHI